tara:strand:- start:65 stop:262 length:198 start_codon:yes stop_codon:yes gene_type:complete
MNKNKSIATIVLVILGFSTSFILFLYQTERLDMVVAQTLALYFFGAFILFGAIYLYFDLKNLNKK